MLLDALMKVAARDGFGRSCESLALHRQLPSTIHFAIKSLRPSKIFSDNFSRCEIRVHFAQRATETWLFENS